MTTISIPITSKQESFIKSLIKKGTVANKAHAVRRALDLMAEEEVVLRVLKSQQEAKEGKILRGNLDDLVKLF